MLYISNATGSHGLFSQFIVCPNLASRKYTLIVALKEIIEDKNRQPTLGASSLMSWRLVPWGSARTSPDYVPQPIRDDYTESCSIVDLSAKAAATLARRAVQGIIRDYWGISKATLKQELDELGKRVGTGDVTAEICQSIDVVRGVGNIGAHMEKDINIIVDVDAEEAQLLIELVEMLVEDTYIARAARQQQYARLLALKQKKEDEKSQAPPGAGGTQA